MISAIENSTRTPATIRRLTALACRDEYETGLERGTPAPKTASRAERLRGTKRFSLGKVSESR